MCVDIAINAELSYVGIARIPVCTVIACAVTKALNIHQRVLKWMRRM